METARRARAPTDWQARTRYQARSTLLTSQLPVASWHARIGDATIADSILDRLVHHAHRMELKGESMRKKHTSKVEKENS